MGTAGKRIASIPGAIVLGWGLAFAAAAGLGAEHWTGFRGPTDQGHADADLPLRWSEHENVVWKTPIPGKAWSSPVVWGDRIWLTNAVEEGTQLSVLCVDKNTGKILISRQVRFVPGPQYCHPFNSYASPSPVVEEGRVYVTFGSPFTGCLDAKTGKVIWERTDLVCNHFRGAGSSPVLYKDLLILHFDGSDLQYVMAFDKHSGRTAWKTTRSVDFQDLDPQTGQPKIDGDYRKAFSTPLIVEVEGKPVLISLGSMCLYAYEPETGKELWRAESPGSHSGSARPVAGHGLVFSPIGYTAELWAVRPDGHGVVTSTHVAWRYEREAPRRASPVLVGDWLFDIASDGVAACLDAKNGKELWKQRLGGNFSASPIHARGRIYCFDEKGKTTILAAAPKFHTLAVNTLEDGFMASPAVSGNALYLRTKTALYRIESPKPR